MGRGYCSYLQLPVDTVVYLSVCEPQTVSRAVWEVTLDAKVLGFLEHVDDFCEQRAECDIQDSVASGY